MRGPHPPNLMIQLGGHLGIRAFGMRPVTAKYCLEYLANLYRQYPTDNGRHIEFLWCDFPARLFAAISVLRCDGMLSITTIQGEAHDA